MFSPFECFFLAMTDFISRNVCGKYVLTNILSTFYYNHTSRIYKIWGYISPNIYIHLKVDQKYPHLQIYHPTNGDFLVLRKIKLVLIFE
jgi:hypothetical protein